MARVEQSRLEYLVVIKVISSDELNEIATWCHDQFGLKVTVDIHANYIFDRTWRLSSNSNYFSGYSFSFDREQDAILFALKWVK